MKKILYILAGLILGSVMVVQAAAPVTPVTGGGTGTSTIPTVGQVLTGQANGTYAPQASSGGSSFSTNPFQATYFVGTSTTATSTIPNLGGVLDASAFAGADIGAKINAAYAALPTMGGKITVPTGTYNYTTPIVFGTNNKVVILQGAGHGGAPGPYPAQYGGTTLNFTTNGAAVTVDTNYSNARSVIKDISIQGKNGDSREATKGVVFGGTNGGFNGALEGVSVSGFGTGVYYGAITSFNTIDQSVIHFNGINISEPDTSGANCEDMRISNSVIADANNQAGGVTDLYGMSVQESGNCQWNIVNTSIDDSQVYINQYGGTANVWSFTNVHFENPNKHQYNFVDTITNVPATEVSFLGGDIMNDKTDGQPSLISMGGDVSFYGTVIDGNSDVTVPATTLVAFDNANNNATAYWAGLKSNGNGALYVYGTVPFSPNGYGTGLSLSPTFYVGPPTTTANGTTTIANLGGVLDATTFAGADIGAKVNAAYASAAKGTIINIPRGVYYFSTPIVFGTDGQTVLLTGAPAEGTQLFWTGGSGAAITINTGIQNTGINHTTGNGIDGIYLHGNSYATTSPQIGVLIGGAHGCDGCVLNATNVFHFGYGIQTAANTYHFLLSNSTIRDNGQNIHINSQGAPDNATNSGESMDFINDFIVDGAQSNPIRCFYIGDYGAASVNITGGSIDDCQLDIGNQILSTTLTGVHMENPGESTWGKYTFINMWDSSYSNLIVNGGTFMNDSATHAPAQYILSNGAGVVLNGLNIFKNSGAGGVVVANLITGGHASWTGLNNTNGGVTNVLTGTAFTRNGTTDRTVLEVASSATLGQGALEISDGQGRAFQFRQNSNYDLNLDTEYSSSWATALTVSRQNRAVGIGTTTPQTTLSIQPTAGVVPFAIASSTGTSLFSVDGAGHIITGGGTPSISTCGVTPSVSGNDTAGTITVGSGVVTACTLTFAKVRTNAPRVVGCVPNSALACGVTSKSTSAVTFSFAATLGSGTVDYLIVE